MKHALTTFVLLMFLSNSLLAQRLFIQASTIKTDDIPVDGWVINVKDDYNELSDHLRDYLKDNYDLKARKNGKMAMTVEKVDLPKLSMKRGDLNAYFFATDTSNVIGFAFLLGYDIFVNQEDYPDEFGRLRAFVLDFMEYHYQTHYQALIDEDNKNIDGIEKDIDQTNRKIRNLEKKLSNLDSKIAKEDEEGKKNNFIADQNEIKVEIETLNGSLPDLKTALEKEKVKLEEHRGELNYYHQQIAAL